MKHFHQPVKNNLVTYDNIGKITTGQGDDCTTVVYLIISISKIITRW